MRIDRLLAGLACALYLGSATGCVFKSSTSQASSESSSDSSSSSSKSSSGEESKSDGVAYERDVRDATARNAAAAAPDTRTYERSISQVAESHRITDWESDPHTYVGIGRGLAQAGIREPEFGRLADDLSHGNPRYRDWIRSGYDTAQP